MVQNVAWNQYVLLYFWLFTGTECCLESVCIILLLSVWWYKMLPGISMYYFTFECLMVQNVAWNQYVLFYFWVFDGTECCLESVCIIILLSVCWYRMLPGISMYYYTFECLMVQNVAWNQYVLFYFWVFDGTECCLESVCIILLLSVWWYRMLPGISMYYYTFECLLVQNVAWNQYVLFYFWVFDGTECCLESVCIILLLSVWWYRMLPGISMYYFTFECLMVQNVAWNQYVLFYFWVFDGTECCLESVCIILLLSVWWYRMLPGISMYYFTFECLMVQNVAWNQYVLFYFWVFDGCLESVCIILLLTVWWYRMLPGISMYYFTFDCLMVQNVAWNQYVLFYFWLFDGTECCLESVCIILLLTVMVQNVAWTQYVLFYFWLFDGTECCLESVCIILLLSVWWYRMESVCIILLLFTVWSRISMYYFTFDCLMVQNVAWNQYVLFYFWLFDGTECCLESVCIILLLSVWWYRMLPGISMYYFTFDCLLVQNVAWNQYVLFYFWVFDGTECCLESVCIILLLSVWWYRMLPGISMYYFTFECLLVQNVAWNQYVLFYFWVFDGIECCLESVCNMYYFTVDSSLFDGTECCLESVCIILLLSVWWYKMLPGISMYYFTFECLMVQNVAWNQYVLFYFWVFDGTECCLESVCIILLLTVYW